LNFEEWFKDNEDWFANESDMDEEKIAEAAWNAAIENSGLDDMREGLSEAIDRIQKIDYGWGFFEIHLLERLRKLL